MRCPLFAFGIAPPRLPIAPLVFDGVDPGARAGRHPLKTRGEELKPAGRDSRPVDSASTHLRETRDHARESVGSDGMQILQPRAQARSHARWIALPGQVSRSASTRSRRRCRGLMVLVGFPARTPFLAPSATIWQRPRGIGIASHRPRAGSRATSAYHPFCVLYHTSPALLKKSRSIRPNLSQQKGKILPKNFQRAFRPPLKPRFESKRSVGTSQPFTDSVAG
jgi:hypothetical protein